MTCSLCGAPAAVLRSPDRNRSRRQPVYEYARCRRCGLVELRTTPDDLASYYGDDYYHLPTLEELRRTAARERYQIGLVTPHAAGGRLVEIGPAWGVFALQATDAGFEVTAVEMDERCCRYLEEVVGVKAVRSDAPEAVLPTLERPQVVALWQVLEHLREPWTVVAAAAERLDPGGVLVVATPNPASLGFRLLRGRWPHLDAPRHLWLLPRELVEMRAAAAGLEVVARHFDDPGARSWNRFAWQRLLMNEVRGRTLQGVAFVLGALLAVLAAPFERGQRASSYTLILRKVER